MKVNQLLSSMGVMAVGVLLTIPGYSKDGSELMDVVQMPVAVDRVVEAGISEHQIGEVARILVDQGVDGRDFNDSIRASAEGLSASAQDSGIGNFTVERIREGLRGRELAEAIHHRLNERGIPAGGWEGEGPPPVARNFIPEHARERIRAREAGRPDHRIPEHAREAQDRRGDPREEVEDRRGGPPADVREQRGRAPEGEEERGEAPPEDTGERQGGPPRGAGDRA